MEAIVERALAKDPSDRYATAGELVEALGDQREFTSSSATTRVTAPVPAMNSIAVLPFLNISADPDNEYFADGMAEEHHQRPDKGRGHARDRAQLRVQLQG